MTDEGVRLFSREYKLAALRRMQAGENVSALARELGIRRKYLYQWRERFRAGVPRRCAREGGRARRRLWRSRLMAWGCGRLRGRRWETRCRPTS